MNLIDRIGHGFIMTFGITKPKPGSEHAAHLVIALVLMGLAAGLVGLVLFVVGRLY